MFRFIFQKYDCVWCGYNRARFIVEQRWCCVVYVVQCQFNTRTNVRRRSSDGLQYDSTYQSDAVSNVAVIIVRVIFISSFLFYWLLSNHSFQTNSNKMTNCFKLFSLLQLYNYIAPASLFWFLNRYGKKKTTKILKIWKIPKKPIRWWRYNK